MNDRTNVYEKFTLAVIAIFLILTAWGNAIAMFTVSAIALVGLLLLRLPTARPWLAVAAGAAVAVVVVAGLNYLN